MTRVTGVHARQILDSRGRPTVEVDVATEDGAFGRAAVPSGASTGTSEAQELRDGTAEYDGLGVRVAVGHVNEEIASAVAGQDAHDQATVDALLEPVGIGDEDVVAHELDSISEQARLCLP